MVIDLKQQIVLANQAFAATVGRKPDELMGRSASDLEWVNSDGTPFPKEAYPWIRALADGSPQRNDMIYLHDRQSARLTFLVNCSPVLGSGGRYGGVLVSLDDVTELEENQAELSAAKEEAEAANQAKSEFLANMSHEIRTPLNATLGFTEVLKRGYEKGEAERKKYLGTIRSSGEHLLQLINDVLDLSRVESGHVELERLRFAPHLLIQEAIAIFQVKAREKNLALEFEAASPIPETLLSDPTRLRQIVTNLLSNAIKFTKSGGVKVTARFLPKGQGRQLSIAVTDSGIGIPSETLEAIFDPFVQADNSVTRRFGGTGLGLAISLRFARLLGGDLVAQSVLGSGSTFTVTIDPGPLDGVRLLEPHEAMAVTREAAVGGTGEWQFPPARILVVDDGDETRELLQLVLEEVGLQVEGAENGQVGVDRARSEPFDLILMDMQMPVMDGYTATSSLRQAGLETPIVALTANAMKGFERECLEAGCTAYLTKPVDLDALVEELARLLGGERRADAPEETPPGDAIAGERPEQEWTGDDTPLVSRLASNPRFHATIEKFVGRLEEKLEAMQACCDSRDFEELARLGHWLKGSAGTVGFDAFSGPAKALELLAKEGKENEIEASISELRRLAERIVVPNHETP